MRENKSDSYEKAFLCLRCAPGCAKCKGPEPCLATYNWPFRYLQFARISNLIALCHNFNRVLFF